jgi:serine/threonine-protein kinase HipA
MNCYGCYKPNVEGYCPSCRKSVWEGARVSPILPFDLPENGDGLQYALLRTKNELSIADGNGDYRIKRGIGSVNEHLSMQIAGRIFGIRTLPNALMGLGDGAYAYISREGQDKGKPLLPAGSCEETGQAIRRYVAAYPPALEEFFQVVLFNYLIANESPDTSHFSLIRTAMGDLSLSPCYGLTNTTLDARPEAVTGAGPVLYRGSEKSSFYLQFGFYGLSEFSALADKLGLVPARRDKFIARLLSAKEEVLSMIRHSFLSGEAKKKYAAIYLSRLERMGLSLEPVVRARPRVVVIYPFNREERLPE